MWVWWFMAHHKTGCGKRCFLEKQSAAASDAVWAA